VDLVDIMSTLLRMRASVELAGSLEVANEAILSVCDECLRQRTVDKVAGALAATLVTDVRIAAVL
jgi:hypothetical protein